MLIIIPAILEQDVKEFERKLKLAAGFAKVIQIDIGDGVFVPNYTAQVAQIAEIAQSVPVAIEWHLMVVEPLDALKSLKTHKPQTVIFHYESVNDVQKTIEAIKQHGHKVGLALNPETPAEVIDRFHDKLDLVTVMGVNPGFQGSPFIPESLEKIEEMKQKFPNLAVEIDGGVNESNLARVIESGAQQVVIGSGLWKNPDPKDQYLKLTELAKQVL